MALSGFMFPRSEMPPPIYLITFGIPATCLIEILRGIELRAADLRDLIPSIAGLVVCGVAVFWLSLIRFQQRLTGVPARVCYLNRYYGPTSTRRK
jgi:ribosome-dependent ATPase